MTSVFRQTPHSWEIDIDKDRLLQLLDGLPGRRIVVVGDLMLDEFIWGKVHRISPEAPVPVVQVSFRSFAPGGAGNVVANLRALGAEVSLVSVVGDDDIGRELRAELEGLGAATRGVLVDAGRPTIRKTRVIAHSQQVVRIDQEISAKVTGEIAERLVAATRQELERADALLISDYDKGVASGDTIPPIIADALAQGKIVTADGKPPNFPLFRRAKLIAPNEAEAAAASGIAIHDHEGVREAGQELINRFELEAVLITRGEHGMSLLTREGDLTHIPAVASEVYDVTGAGDTVIACCTLALAAGGDLVQAAALANCAAGVVVKKVGTATASPEEIRALL